MPVDDLLDENKCCHLLMETLHPGGLRCPEGHALPPDQAPHDRRRAPIVDDRCKECGSVFNLWTGTALQGRHWKCSTIVIILRGFAHGNRPTGGSGHRFVVKSRVSTTPSRNASNGVIAIPFRTPHWGSFR